MSIDEPLAYSVREAAAVVGVSHVTINNECNDGRLPFFVVGHVRRIRKAELEKWMEARQHDTMSEKQSDG